VTVALSSIGVAAWQTPNALAAERGSGFPLSQTPAQRQPPHYGCLGHVLTDVDPFRTQAHRLHSCHASDKKGRRRALGSSNRVLNGHHGGAQRDQGWGDDTCRRHSIRRQPPHKKR